MAPGVSSKSVSAFASGHLITPLRSFSIPAPHSRSFISSHMWCSDCFRAALMQVIARLTEWASRMVKEQCREILMYSVCGEYSSIPVGDEEIDGGSVSANFKQVLSEFGCGAALGEPAFPGGEPAGSTSRGTAALSTSFGGSFDDMVAAAATPAAIGGAPRALGGLDGPIGAVDQQVPPLDPFEVIRILEAELARQQHVIEDMQSELMNRPPMTVAFGTSAANMITVQLPHAMH